MEKNKITPKFNVGDALRRKGKDYIFIVDRIQGGFYHCDHKNGAFFPIEEQDDFELVGLWKDWNEDEEKVRKTLIAIFDSRNQSFVDELTNYSGTLTREEILDWLNKQGEEKPIDNVTVWKRIVDEVLTKFNGIGQYLDNPLTTKVAEELWKKHSYLTLRGLKFVRASIEKALSYIEDSDCDKAKLILTEAKEMLELERES